LHVVTIAWVGFPLLGHVTRKQGPDKPERIIRS
jgi:hypothetical protein